MKQTFTVLFFLKTSKINIKGKAPVYLRVTVNGKRSEVSTQHFIVPSKWNSKKQRLNGTTYEVKCINRNLDLILSKIHESNNNLLQNGKLISAKAITNKYLE